MKHLGILLMLMFFQAQANEGTVYGKGDFTSPEVKLDTLIKDYEKYKDQKVQVVAQVEQVCQMKGCWVQIKDGQSQVRAIMKEHAFSVPKDLKDKTVKLEGQLVQKELPAKVLRHYMKDEGKSEAEINKVTRPQKTFQFIADGVKAA